MLADKFIEFLKEIGCNYYENIIPNRIKGGITELSINGDIPKDKLDKLLRDIEYDGFQRGESLKEEDKPWK